jgi:DnaJ family protein C protein 13
MASQAAGEVAALSAAIRQQHAAGKAEWALAPGAAIRYAKLAGEAYVGGVYVRLFMKNPRYAIRDPKRFSEALLHKFLAELQGTPGSSGAPTNSSGAEHTGTLLLLSAAAVALLQGHALLADHVAQLGYASRLLVCLAARTAAIPASAPTPSDAAAAAAAAAPPVVVAPDEIGGSILRLLHQLAASPAAAEALASASSAPLVPTVMKAMAWGHGATLLVLELLKRALAPGNRQRDTLVGQALGCSLPQALLAMLDWRQSESGGGAAAEQEAQVQRALAVDVLTALAEEGAYGAQVGALLAGSEVWGAYRGQRHDMFLPSGATADSGVVGLLTAGDTARYALPPTEDPAGAGGAGAS